MKFGRWLLLAVVASFAAMLVVSSAFGRGQSAVIFDYEVTNDGGILFADEFDRLGGVDTLGYPASYRFELDGFTYQVTQRALLQWRSNIGVAYLGNIFEMLEHAGLDQWLLESKGIPLPIKDDGSNGDWNKARETRLSWLTNEQIKAKFLANPNPDAISDWNVDSAINLYGLPMSMPERHGPFISQRFQRVAFQLWVDEVAGSPAPGTVIGVLAGDLLKEAGLVPPEGLNVAERPVVVVAPAPAPAPAPSTSQPRATAKPRATARPQATAEPTTEATVEPTAEATPEATPIAADLTLSALGLSGVTLNEDFAAETGTYTASVANDVDSTTVTATAANAADATVAITPDDTDAATDGHQVALAEGADTTITIEVTVGEATAAYTVTVTRAAAVTATLSALSLSGVTLNEAFAADTTEYTASVLFNVETTTVTATASDDDAEVAIAPGDAATTDGHQVTLGTVGANTITVTVTSGVEEQEYTIVVTRGPETADPTLSGLTLGTGIDSIGISAEATTYVASTHSYDFTVPNSVEQVTVTTTVRSGSNAVIVMGVVQTSGDAFDIEDGLNTIEIRVTSADASATQTYTLNVTRRASPSGDVSLSQLTVEDIELNPSPFNPETLKYSATIPYGDTDELMVTVLGIANAADRTLAYSSESFGSLAGSSNEVTLPVGLTQIKVVVSESGADPATRTYVIEITRQARVLGTNADLDELSLNNVVLDPATFDADVRSYGGTVANAIETTTLTVSVPDVPEGSPDLAVIATVRSRINDGEYAAVTLNDDGTGTVADLSLDRVLPAINVIDVEVTAEDGTTKKVYTIRVSRRASGGTSDNSLSQLTLTAESTGGTDQGAVALNPAFDPDELNYLAEVAASITTIAVNAVPNLGGATLTVNGQSAQSGDDEDVTLAAAGGETVITVAVTADSVTTNYVIRVNRLLNSTDATLKTLTLTTGPDDNLVTVGLGTFSPDTLMYSGSVVESNDLTLTLATTHQFADVTSVTLNVTPATEGIGEDAGTWTMDTTGRALVRVAIVVTAEDTTAATKTYIIDLTVTPSS